MILSISHLNIKQSKRKAKDKNQHKEQEMQNFENVDIIDLDELEVDVESDILSQEAFVKK